MKRKTVAICISGYHKEEESKIISEIIRNCTENDINVLIFVSLMKESSFPENVDLNSNLVRGESEIFNLINYKMIDAMVIFSRTIYNQKKVTEIIKKCEINNIPCINVNNPLLRLTYNVNFENSSAMDLIMEHLVKVHKCSRINFIGGNPDGVETIDRLNSYKKVLTEHNIPVEENRIGYGYYWKRSVDCVKQFLKTDIPQAIVCANDSMAIFVCDYLKNAGYRIPQDIIVTGFDGIRDACLCEPSITTVRPRYYYTGQEVFKILKDIFDGKGNIPEEINIDSELIIQKSCGCKNCNKVSRNFVEENIDRQNLQEVFNQKIVRSDVMFFDEQNPDDLFENLANPLEVFRLKTFMFCIDNNLETKENYFFGNQQKKNGIPSRVRCCLPYTVNFSKGTVFSSKNILWYDFLNQDEPSVRCFTSFYFKEHTLGYLVYELPDFENFENELFQLWTYEISEKIGMFYMTRELEQNNLKDHLTDLYNRRGLEKFYEKIRKQILTERKYISVICIDIDYLKTINDKYGHEAGDNAIIQTSKAIKHAFSRNAIGVRTGGDEFCVVHYSEKKTNIEKLIQKFTDYLTEYNKISGLPYEIMGSCGYSTVYSDDFISFEKMSKEADSELYTVKNLHHILHR